MEWKEMIDGFESRPVVAPLGKSSRRRGTALVADQLKHANLMRTGKVESTAPDCQFHSNEEFWNKLLLDTCVPMKWVTLKRFQLVDWFPRAPGLYHTGDGRRARASCRGQIFGEDLGWYYEPIDKSHLI